MPTARRSLLETLGSLETLAGHQKIYTAIKRHIRPRSEIRYGAERDDRLLGEIPVELHRTITGEGPTFTVDVYDDTGSQKSPSTVRRIELQIDLNHLSPADVLQVSIDGTKLGQGTRVSPATKNTMDPSEVAENTWLVWELTPADITYGRHKITVVLIERDPRLLVPIVIDNVEVHISYI